MLFRSVVTNITPDHLDRYDHKFQNYIDSKFRIIRNQRPEDRFIYGIDNPETCREVARRNPALHRLPFTSRSYRECAEAGMPLAQATAESGSAAPQGAFLTPEGTFAVSVNDRSVTIDPARMQVKGIPIYYTVWKHIFTCQVPTLHSTETHIHMLIALHQSTETHIQMPIAITALYSNTHSHAHLCPCLYRKPHSHSKCILHSTETHIHMHTVLLHCKET